MLTPLETIVSLIHMLPRYEKMEFSDADMAISLFYKDTRMARLCPRLHLRCDTTLGAPQPTPAPILWSNALDIRYTPCRRTRLRYRVVSM